MGLKFVGGSTKLLRDRAGSILADEEVRRKTFSAYSFGELITMEFAAIRLY